METLVLERNDLDGIPRFRTKQFQKDGTWPALGWAFIYVLDNQVFEK